MTTNHTRAGNDVFPFHLKINHGYPEEVKTMVKYIFWCMKTCKDGSCMVYIMSNNLTSKKPPWRSYPFLCVKLIIILLPLGVETGLSLFEHVGEAQIDPLNICRLSLGDCTELPFSIMLLDAEVVTFKTRFCTPYIVSKSGLVFRKRKKEKRPQNIRNESRANFFLLWSE